jgi:hypothetical protein
MKPERMMGTPMRSESEGIGFANCGGVYTIVPAMKIFASGS